MSQVATSGPANGTPVPVLKEKSPEVLLIASFLRTHSLLKLRQGSVNGQNVEFFRYKRCIRALTSSDYQDSALKQKVPANPELLNNPQLAQRVFIALISNQLVVPITKLSTLDARSNGFKPTKESPCFVPLSKCALADNEYFYWTFTPNNPLLPLYSLLGIVGILTLICFPLWPMVMRRGAWYISMLLLGAILLLFILAIVRLVVFLVLSPFTKFWIFPNLFADVGFFESFVPLYEFELEKQPKKSKSKKSKNSAPPAVTTPETATATSTATKPQLATKRKVILEEVEE